jgi:hypothetical protein
MHFINILTGFGPICWSDLFKVLEICVQSLYGNVDSAQVQFNGWR